MVAISNPQSAYKKRAKYLISKMTNQVHLTLNGNSIEFDIESQKDTFVKRLLTTPPIDIIRACREFIEEPVEPSYSWQPKGFAMAGSSLIEFRRLLKESEGEDRFTQEQLEQCFDIFAENVHSRLNRLSPPITVPDHIKPHEVDSENKPVFLMCEPNAIPQKLRPALKIEPHLFSYATPYVGRLYLWQMMKNAIEAAGGDVKLVHVQEHRRKERDVFVRDPLIRDTHGVLIRSEWHDKLIQFEQPKLLESIAEHSGSGARYQLESKNPSAIKSVHASIENGNIATDHKRHILFIGHDEKDVVTKDAHELQKKTKSQVIPLLIDRKQAGDFYHLDMCMTELQSGQFIWCPKAFTSESRAMIENTIPAEDRIAIDIASARQGACNCVTVGKTIITPYASDTMKSDLEDHGYHVETSQTVGLPKGILLKFGLGAIHCATFFIGTRKDQHLLN